MEDAYTRSLRTLIDYFKASVSQPYDYVKMFSDEYYSLVNSIYSEFLKSRHFITFVCSDIKGSDDRKIREGLKRVETFWSQYDYDNLVESLNAQFKYMHCDDVPDGSVYGVSDVIDELLTNSSEYQRKKHDVDLFFHETFNFHFIDDSDLYARYRSAVDEEFEKRIKHKKANDNNGIFIYSDYEEKRIKS